MTIDSSRIEAGQTYEIDIFRPDDAPGVVRLFQEVYGQEYPVKLVYDEDALREGLKNGTNIPVLARTPKGDIIGYEAYYNSAPHRGLYELGQGLVLTNYRNSGIINVCHDYAVNVMAPRFKMDAVFGEAVCNHIYMQRSWSAAGTIATAMEIDLMPAEAYRKEGSASGRVATVPMFRTIRPRPHKVYLPERYEEALTFIYGNFDDQRSISQSRQGVPTVSLTEMKTTVFDFARVARIGIPEAGEDFFEVFAEEEEGLLGRNMVVIQVWLKLTSPWINSTAEFLRSRGYFLGGVLPRWFDDDGLLMQKIVAEPNWGGIQVYTEVGKEILKLVKADWESLNQQT
ncbi:MAG: hypothetical protein HY770_05195 [Chitinivibrionia bacterium]|nr:hypothetical protein [Chitinivibrionia bacterium]